MSRQERYALRKPWVRFVRYARRRCGDRRGKWWKFYGGRGIEAPLTAAEAEILWRRDGADAMDRPSLDRMDADGPYSRDNCRFIEFRENLRLAWDAKTGGDSWRGVSRAVVAA